MNSLAIFLAQLALALPVADDPVDTGGAALTPPAEQEQTTAGDHAPGWIALEAMQRVPVVRQVRIEQRMTIRIAPQSPVVRQNLMADLRERAEQPLRFEERKIGNCLPVRNIAGVQAESGNRLLLFLRDQRMVSASLEKACRARDFYSGFYLERNKDGMLCVDRDKLQARSGANCEISRLRQLVAVGD